MILERFHLQGDHEEVEKAEARLKIVDINGRGQKNYTSYGRDRSFKT